MAKAMFRPQSPSMFFSSKAKSWRMLLDSSLNALDVSLHVEVYFPISETQVSSSSQATKGSEDVLD